MTDIAHDPNNRVLKMISDRGGSELFRVQDADGKPIYYTVVLESHDGEEPLEIAVPVDSREDWWAHFVEEETWVFSAPFDVADEMKPFLLERFVERVLAELRGKEQYRWQLTHDRGRMEFWRAGLDYTDQLRPPLANTICIDFLLVPRLASVQAVHMTYSAHQSVDALINAIYLCVMKDVVGRGTYGKLWRLHNYDVDQAPAIAKSSGPLSENGIDDGDVLGVVLLDG